MKVVRHPNQDGHIDLLFDLLYSGPEMSVSVITQKAFTRLPPKLIFRDFSSVSRSSLLGGYIST